MYYIYIIKTLNDTLYTGITTNIVRRFQEHSGKLPRGAKYTRSNPPKSIEALWQCESRSDASKLEAKIKSLSKASKLKLISDIQSFPFSCEIYKRINIKDINFNEV